MLWFLSIGIGLALAAHQFGNMPYTIYQKSEFWLNSPSLIMIKLGVILAMLALAWLWVNLAAPERWSLFRQLGTTSLIVYWVHIELVYGRWLGIWKEALSVGQVLAVTAVLLILMVLISIGQTKGKGIWAMLKSPVPQPRRASGD
jgi:fucose 4-O-acetylase-like acetyltransferase